MGIGAYAIVIGVIGAFLWFPAKFLGPAILVFHKNYYVSAVVTWA
jgi:hypothetical protein